MAASELIQLFRAGDRHARRRQGVQDLGRVAGIDAKDIDVSVSGDTLILKGEKRQEKDEKDQNYHFSERSYGSFQRSFQLPSRIDQNKVAADFSKGVLTITLPKTAEAQKPQKKIEVRSA